MKSPVIAALALAACTVLSPPQALATTMFPQKFKCPIGGEKFESFVIGSYSSWGSRPDGRSYGTLPIMPVTECPCNGFILIGDTYSKEEIATLTALVASAEYQAMRKTETAHFRAWQEMKAIGRAPAALAGTLLEASWETDDDAARKARYQRLYIEAVDALPRPAAAAKEDGEATTQDRKDWFFLNLRAANAQRELGDFAGAGTRLDLLSQNLDHAGYGADEADEADEKAGLEGFVAKLRRLVSENNSWFEPANLVPLDVASHRCDMAEPALTPAEREVCDSPALAERRAELKRYAEEAKADAP